MMTQEKINADIKGSVQHYIENQKVYEFRTLLYKNNYLSIIKEQDEDNTELQRLLELTPKKYQAITSKELKFLVHKKLKDNLEKPHRINKSILSNIESLTNLLRLNRAEIKILNFIILAQTNSNFEHILEHFKIDDINAYEIHKYFSFVLGEPSHLIRKALDSRSALIKNKIIVQSGYRSNLNYDIEDDILTGLTGYSGSIVKRFEDRFKTSEKSKARISDYKFLGNNLEIIEKIISHTYETNKKGTNILLYGLPGVGKTSFVSAISKKLKLSLFQVSDKYADGEPLSRNGRMAAFSLCHEIVKNTEKPLVLFDEIEDMFDDSPFGFATKSKSWINASLENNEAPCFWLSNNIEAIDRAHLRRFDFILEFKNPSSKYRDRFINKSLSDIDISQKTRNLLTENKDLSMGEIERVANVTKVVSQSSDISADEIANQLHTNYMTAFGKRLPKSNKLDKIPYNVNYLNADIDLSELKNGLLKQNEGRLCFYGPPGTGKTEYAKQLAKLSGKTLIKKSASDILGCYVGETEKKMAEAFNQADSENAILLFDEVDSFLSARSAGNKNWENSMVNEMLTQIETFDGILICTTNRLNDLDAAVIRRFDAKVNFDYLKHEDALNMLKAIFKQQDIALPKDATYLNRLKKLSSLAMGDFAVAARKTRLMNKSTCPLSWLAILEDECKIKLGSISKQIGFLAQ